MVPSMMPEQLAIVSALVGAGGNAGAVFAGFAFYKQDWEDPLTPFQLHAVYVIFWAILSVFYSWTEHGSMFRAPATPATKSEGICGTTLQRITHKSDSELTLTRAYDGDLELHSGEASPSTSVGKRSDETPSAKARNNDATPQSHAGGMSTKNLLSKIPEIARV
jgi:hypothetical protein